MLLEIGGWVAAGRPQKNAICAIGPDFPDFFCEIIGFLAEFMARRAIIVGEKRC
jgi:hypothetical protein